MGKRILVVEDDRIVRKFTTTVLGVEGHDVLAAASVKEAKEIIADQPPGEPLSLVMDVVLNGESGIEFAQELIQKYPNYQILLISGYTDDLLMTKPEDVARTAFLAKPFSRRELAEALRKLWETRASGA